MAVETAQYDILDSDYEPLRESAYLKRKQLQMKYGEIWQTVIGEYDTFEDLKVGAGLDVLSVERKIAMELKNRYNTDNAASKKTNLDKLAQYKKENPEYQCIYGVINDKTIDGKIKSIYYNEQEIHCYSGMKLFDHCFGKDRELVLYTVKKTVHDLHDCSLLL